jgi:hypothetical protein
MTKRTGFCQEAWLLIAEGGGWWRASDILEQLPSGIEVDDASCQLWIMANRHNYLKRRGRGMKAEYCVTQDCVTPRGLPVRRVNQALFGAQQGSVA